jgi:hypothetical protein
VRKTIGLSAPFGSARSRVHTSKPVMPGMRTSSSTQSAGRAAKACKASSPPVTLTMS